MVFFFLSFIFFGFGFWFSTVALLAWRVVFFCGHWVGLGLGFIIQHRGKFCPRLDYTGTCYLFIDEMEGEDGRVWAGGRRQDAFC